MIVADCQNESLLPKSSDNPFAVHFLKILSTPITTNEFISKVYI